ncbi:hypothetical protein POM88_021945 [Heracleum sosnowskyi]|uniref:FCP1 homology domain-containing protein n=1 Tax=Heracleum sosnowskyi TaxID=360622 RepID=A0AAD8MP89_9APIA|nr:hypothetical protein POM88_021945 [Heracleum sosnowskyi]
MEGLLVEDVTLQTNSTSSGIHPDSVILTKPAKKKKKKRNNSNSLVNVDPMEDVTLPRNSTASEMLRSDIVMSAEQEKKMNKKRKRGGNNLNALANVNLVQQPVDGTCLVTDSRLEHHDVQVEDYDNIQKTRFSNLSLSNDSNISGRDSGLIVDSRSTLQVKVNQVPEADVNPVSMIVEHNDQVCANKDSKELSLDAPLDQKKRKKKKKNLNTEADMNPVSMTVEQNDQVCANKDSKELSLDAPLDQKKRKKKKKNLNTEVDVNPVSLIVEHDDQVCANNDSKELSLDAPLDQKKRKKKKKNLNTEADVNPVSMIVEHNDQVCANNDSKQLSLDAPLDQKKRKKKKKNLNTEADVNPVSMIVEHDDQVCANNDSKQLSLDAPLDQKKRKKKKKNLNTEADVNPVSMIVEHDDQVCANNDSKQLSLDAPLDQKKRKKKKKNLNTEADVNPVSMIVEHNDQVCANNGSKELNLDAPLDKKNRKKKKKNLNTLVNSVIVPSTSVMVDPELVQQITEQLVSQGIHQNECATKHRNCSGEDSSGITDAKVDKISVSQDMDPIHKVRGDVDLACSVDISGKRVMVPLQEQKTKSKKKKKNLNTLVKSVIMPSTSVMGDPESMQHITEQLVSQGINQNECATKDRIFIGEDSSDIIDAKVDKISVSQIMDPIHKVAGNDDLASGVEISGKMVMVPLQAQETKSKKKGKNLFTSVSSVIPGPSVMGDPELMQHITEQLVSQGIHQNECATKDRNCSGEDSSGITDAKVDKISVSQDMDPIHKVAGDDDLASGVEISGKMVMVPLQAQKTKRKKKRKNLTMLVSSVIPNTSVMGDPKLVPPESKQQPMQHSTEQVVSQEIQQNECATKDKNCSGEDSSGICDAKVDKISVSVDMEPIHKVAGDDDQACGVDISGKMVTVPLQAQKTKRKKKKKNPNMLVSSVIMPSTSVMGDPELMQHSTKQGVSQGIHQNECATNDKNCSGEDSSGIVDAKVDEISVSEDKAVGNMHGGKMRKRKIRGNNLNLEPEEGVICSSDLLEEQQVKRVKLNDDQNVGIGRMLTGSVQKKLLVLDLNGLLADVVGDKTVRINADGHVAGKKVFKRPFCEDFLQFCFNRFTVGVWSSRRKENVDKVLQVLMPEEDRSKLAFVWNQSHCTRTGKVVDYDESNTLLLDDSPYKALLNPPYTAVFPTPYRYQDQNDDGLGPGGDLRVYLEGLALAENVKEYVEQNPFGQKSIMKSDPSWSYYAKVIQHVKEMKKKAISK